VAKNKGAPRCHKRIFATKTKGKGKAKIVSTKTKKGKGEGCPKGGTKRKSRTTFLLWSEEKVNPQTLQRGANVSRSGQNQGGRHRVGRKAKNGGKEPGKK